jgi:predicted  nucleic acid-binding Zn-ribbon protein
MTIDEKLDLLLMSFDQFHRSMDVRFERLEERLDRIEERMAQLEVRMDKLEIRMGKLESRMDKIESRMDRQELRTDGIEHKLHAHVEKYNSDQTLIQASLFKLESSFKYVLHKQQEHDITIHSLQLQMDKQ